MKKAHVSARLSEREAQLKKAGERIAQQNEMINVIMAGRDAVQYASRLEEKLAQIKRECDAGGMGLKKRVERVLADLQPREPEPDE